MMNPSNITSKVRCTKALFIFIIGLSCLLGIAYDAMGAGPTEDDIYAAPTREVCSTMMALDQETDKDGVIWVKMMDELETVWHVRAPSGNRHLLLTKGVFSTVCQAEAIIKASNGYDMYIPTASYFRE